MLGQVSQANVSSWMTRLLLPCSLNVIIKVEKYPKKRKKKKENYSYCFCANSVIGLLIVLIKSSTF